MSLDAHLRIDAAPDLSGATLLIALSGWMDGGDVSTGTVQQLIDLLAADPIASIDCESFYISNLPGSMEVAAMFRPHIVITDGVITSVEMPSNVFFCHSTSNLVLFKGKEPNLRWRTFAECLFTLCRRVGVQHILFVGSFGGSVPHTREPRLYVTCSHRELLEQMEQYGARRSSYEGPGSFTSYLMTQAPAAGLQMTSLVAEIPGYLQGVNPASIAAILRRLSKMLNLQVDLDSLRSASTQWELEVSSAVEKDDELRQKIRDLEEDYDDELLQMEKDE